MQSDPLDWIEPELSALDARQLLRRRMTRQSPQGARIVVDGHELINFGSNDYLDLASDCRIVEAVRAAVEPFGWGSGASPLISGLGRLHVELEQELARFEGTEGALVFASGFVANTGTIAALVDRGDIIFSDASNHASIIDGCRLSRAEIEVYRHTDVDHLRWLMDRSKGFRRRLIVTDGLFSMEGDMAPLRELAQLADRYGAMLMVDEAHATGVFGSRGRGISEHLGVEEATCIRVGTLSKALGSAGGFVAGSRSLVDWLINRARPYIYSTAPPEPVCAAALGALRIVREEPQRRESLRRRADLLRAQLEGQGWQIGSSQSQIIPLVVGDASATMKFAQQLRERGFLVPGIRPPSVPQGRSLLRISLCHGHDDTAIQRLLVELNQLRATAPA